LLPFFQKSSEISNDDLSSYAQVYLNQYRSFVEDYYSQLSSAQGNLSNFPLYVSYPNYIVGIISRTHGAALFFNYSQMTGNKIDIKEISNPIEYYIYPSMPLNMSGLPWVLVKHADTDYVLDSPVSIPYGLLYVESGANLRYTGLGHAFNITNFGAIAIFGSLIEENRMILKGSKEKEDWSTTQARLDSLSAFISDCQGIINESVIDNIRTTYEPSFLLNKMLTRLKSGEYRNNPWLFTQDYQKLQQAGADNTTLAKIQTDYINMQETEPPSLVNIVWDFFVDHILGGMLFGTILGGLLVSWLSKRRQKNIKSKKQATPATGIAQAHSANDEKKKG